MRRKPEFLSGVIGPLVEIWTEKAIPLKAQTKTRNKVLEGKCRGHLCYPAVKTLWDIERRTRLLVPTAVLGSGVTTSAAMSCHSLMLELPEMKARQDGCAE